MPKFTNAERTLVKTIVASLTIKRIPDMEIIRSIFEQTKKTVSIRYLTNVKQQIKSRKIATNGTRPCVKVNTSTFMSSKRG